MGFPRILSKNNKIYTKLGEFCLSGDASFWIVCQVCQEELQTQDQFWKHIQDEHNFMHGLGFKQEPARNYMEAEATTAHLMPLPLYRKVNEEELRASSALDHGDNSHEKQEPKDYTEMRAIEPDAVQIDIKVEPPNIRHTLAMAPPQQLAAQQNVQRIAAAGGNGGGDGDGSGGGGGSGGNGGAGNNISIAHQNIEVSTAPPTLYQLPHVTPVSSYASAIVHNASTLAHTISMPSAIAAAALMSQHEMPKIESNSTTASASSVMSSEDGERWYVCDYETCGLKFKYQSRLELHRAVHSKERRFACELCGASFKQSCNLSTHRKKKHFLKGSKVLVPQHF
ncbi:AT-rich binding protein [Eurosta solidaginis]|uniref:AT-rich binding protein n=1 Tax=Eurosta solidaginis TaxID=178769 RepID=UPI00353158CE